MVTENIHIHPNGAIQGCHGQGKVREKQKFFKVREKSGNFAKSQGKSQFLSKSGKSQGILFSHLVKFMKTFSFRKLSCRLCGFGFKFDNSPNARSVKIVLRSVKSQGIFWVLMGGNPGIENSRL